MAAKSFLSTPRFLSNSDRANDLKWDRVACLYVSTFSLARRIAAGCAHLGLFAAFTETLPVEIENFFLKAGETHYGGLVCSNDIS